GGAGADRGRRRAGAAAPAVRAVPRHGRPRARGRRAQHGRRRRGRRRRRQRGRRAGRDAADPARPRRAGRRPGADRRVRMTLSARQELLLAKVVDGYAETGQPVGSKALAADPEISWGPSTVRNELSVLEELGLLAHPHTSAGRAPTDTGHRYYVDRLLPGTDVAVAPDLRLE